MAPQEKDSADSPQCLDFWADNIDQHIDFEDGCHGNLDLAY